MSPEHYDISDPRQEIAKLNRDLAALKARFSALERGDLQLPAQGLRVGTLRLLEKLVSDEYHLHQRDADGTERDLTDAISFLGRLLSTTAPTASQFYAWDADLEKWVPTSPGAPGAHALGGASHTADILANLNAKVSDATLDDSGDPRTPTAHSHTESDISDLDHLTEAEAVAAVEAADPLSLAHDLEVDAIKEKTPAAGIILDLVTKIKDAYVLPNLNYPDAYYWTGAVQTYLSCDSGDYIQFIKATNRWQFFIANTLRLTVNPDGVEVSNPLYLVSTESTISSGSADVDRAHHTIDTEGDAASDDLGTLAAKSGYTLQTGQLLLLRAENVARVVTVKHGTGNILLVGSADYDLDAADKILLLVYDGSNWREVSRTTTLGYVQAQVVVPITDTPAADADGPEIPVYSALSSVNVLYIRSKTALTGTITLYCYDEDGTLDWSEAQALSAEKYKEKAITQEITARQYLCAKITAYTSGGEDISVVAEGKRAVTAT